MNFGPETPLQSNRKRDTDEVSLTAYKPLTFDMLHVQIKRVNTTINLRITNVEKFARKLEEKNIHSVDQAHCM